MKMKNIYTFFIALFFLSSLNLSAQNVGIGTPSPDYVLDVNGNMGINDFIYHNDDPNEDTYIGFPADDAFELQLGGKTIFQSDATGNQFIINPLGQGVDFLVEGDSFEHIFIVQPSTGRVGVGTATPQYAMDVAGDFRVEGDSFEHIIYANSTTGTVGIGTAAPAYLLDVAGDFRIEGDSFEHLFYVDTSNDKVGINKQFPNYTMDVGGTLNTEKLRIGGNLVFQRFQSNTEVLGAFPGQSIYNYTVIFPTAFTTIPTVVATFRSSGLSPNVVVNVTISEVTTTYVSLIIYRVDDPGVTLGGEINWIAFE